MDRFSVSMDTNKLSSSKRADRRAVAPSVHVVHRFFFFLTSSAKWMEMDLQALKVSEVQVPRQS
jgi:hypothetical protein